MPFDLRRQHEKYTIGLIEDAFMDIYEKKGLSLTVNEICEKTGVSRPVFYRLYDDKFEVLEKIEDRLIEDLRKINEKMPSAAFSSEMEFFPYVEESVRYVDARRDRFRPLICRPGDMNFVNRWSRLMRDDIVRRMDYEKKNLKNMDVYTYAISVSAIGVYEYWLKEKPQMSVQEVSRIVSSLWKSFY